MTCTGGNVVARGKDSSAPLGFTVIEMLISLILFTISLALATSVFSSYQARTAAQRAAQVFAMDLSVARAAAVRGRVPVIVNFDEAGKTYLIRQESGDTIDDFETLYLIGSEGVYTDPTFTGSAARRTVYQYAVKREIALDHIAAVTQVTGDLYVRTNAHMDGEDGASILDCAQTSVDIIGVLMGFGSLTVEGGSPIRGSPDSVSLGSATAALDAIGIDWDVLTDTDFPVDYEDAWPSCALPADSFTVTRFNGNLSAPISACGRGVLIVKGNFFPAHGFAWDGIVLAGYIVNTPNDFRIDGLVVGGLDGNGTATSYNNNTHLDYHRCYAFEAGKRLSHFEPVGSTWWEEM